MSAAEIKLFKNKDLILHISFSFDGENAGKLMGTNNTMEYSVDGGLKWTRYTESNEPNVEGKVIS